MFGFDAPLLFLLLPLPLLLRWLMPPRRQGEAAALMVPDGVLVSALGSGGTGIGRGLARLGLLLPVLLWLGLVTALAGPQRTMVSAAAPLSGRDLILVIDLSGSMEQKDFTLDGVPAERIAVVRQAAADFVRGRRGDRIGLVVFGDTAYFAAPPSFDVAAIAEVAAGMTIGIAGRSTAISDGLGLALKRLAVSEAPSRVLILLSDGTNTAGDVDPRAAARLAAELGIRIHTIALGPQSVSEGNSSRNAVDDVTLAAIAGASGGTHFRVRTIEDMERVGAEIDRLETSPTAEPPLEIRTPLWPWPAGVAIAAALALLVPQRRLR